MGRQEETLERNREIHEKRLAEKPLKRYLTATIVIHEKIDEPDERESFIEFVTALALLPDHIMDIVKLTIEEE